MPIMPIRVKAHRMGKVASPSYACALPVFIPIVPIIYLLNVVVIRKREETGTSRCIYARNRLNRLGTAMGTRSFICEKK